MALNKNYNFNPNDISWMDAGSEPAEKSKLAKAMKFIFGAAKGIAIGTAEGVFDKMKDSNLDGLEDFQDEINEMSDHVNKSVGELKSGLGEAVSAGKKLGLKYTESARGLMTQRMYRRLSRAFEEPEEESYSPADRFESSLSSNLASIFNAQSKQNAGYQRISLKSAETDRVLRAKYHNQDIEMAMVTHRSVNSIDSFLHTTYVNYLKKDLELKYRSYNTATIIMKHIDTVAKEFREEGMVGSLIKAASMSDRTKLEQEATTRNRSAAAKFTTTDAFDKKFYEELMENATGFPSMALSMFSMFGDIASSTPSNGVQDLTAPLARLFAVPLLNKLKGRLSKQNQSRIDKLLNRAKSKLDILNGDMTDFVKNRVLHKNSLGARLRGSNNPFLTMLGNFFPEFKRETEIENKAAKNPTDPAVFDNLTRESIVSVIPEHLARIGDQIEALAKSQGVTPDDSTQKVYDIRTHSLVTRAERRERNLANMYGTKTTRNDRYNDNVNTFIKLIRTGNNEAAMKVQEGIVRDNALYIHMFLMRSARVMRQLDTFTIAALQKLRNGEGLSFQEMDYISSVFGRNDAQARRTAAAILDSISRINTKGQFDGINFQLVREVNKRITELGKEQDTSDIARQHLADMGMYDEEDYRYNTEGGTFFDEKSRTREFAADAEGAGELPELYESDVEKLKNKLINYKRQKIGMSAEDSALVDEIANTTGISAASILPNFATRALGKGIRYAKSKAGKSFGWFGNSVAMDQLKKWAAQTAKNLIYHVVPRFNSQTNVYDFQVDMITSLKVLDSKTVVTKHHYSQQDIFNMEMDGTTPNSQLQKLVKDIVDSLGGDKLYAVQYSQHFWEYDAADEEQDDTYGTMISRRNTTATPQNRTTGGARGSSIGYLASINQNVQLILRRMPGEEIGMAGLSSGRRGAYRGLKDVAVLHAEGDTNMGIPLLDKVKNIASETAEKTRKSKMWGAITRWIKRVERPSEQTDYIQGSKDLFNNNIDPNVVVLAATQAINADKQDAANKLAALNASKDGDGNIITDTATDLLKDAVGGIIGSTSTYAFLKHHKWARTLVKLNPKRLLTKSLPRAIKRPFVTGAAKRAAAKGVDATSRGLGAVGDFTASHAGFFKVAGGALTGGMMGFGGSRSSNASWESTAVSTATGAGAGAIMTANIWNPIGWALAGIMAINAAREGWMDKQQLKKTWGAMYNATKTQKGASAFGNILNYLSFGLLKETGLQKYVDKTVNAIGLGYVTGSIGESIAASLAIDNAGIKTSTDKADDKQIMQARAKLHVDVERGYEGASERLAQFEKAVAMGDWDLARNLGGIKDESLNQAKKRAAKAWSFADDDDLPMDEDEVKRGNKIMMLLTKRDPEYKEYALDFKEAVMSERWSTARRIAGMMNPKAALRSMSAANENGALSRVSSYMEQLKHRAELGDMFAAERLESMQLALLRGDYTLLAEQVEGVGPGDAKASLEQEKQRWEARLARGDKSAAEKLAKINWSLEHMGQAVTYNANEYGYAKETKKYTQQELNTFRETLRRQIESGNQAAARTLDRFEEAVAMQDWDTVDDIIGDTDVSPGKFKKSSTGFTSWLKRNFTASGDQAYPMTDAEVMAQRRRFKDLIDKTGSPIVEQKLKDFERAVADENWPEARRISGEQQRGAFIAGVTREYGRVETDNKMRSESNNAKRYRLIFDRVQEALQKRNLDRMSKQRLLQLKDDMKDTELLDLNDTVLSEFEKRLSDIDKSSGIILKEDIEAHDAERREKAQLLERRDMLLKEIVNAQKRCSYFDYGKRAELRNLFAYVDSLALSDIDAEMLDIYDENLRLIDREAISTKTFEGNREDYQKAYQRKNNLLGNIDEVISNTSWYERSKLADLKQLKRDVESALPEDLMDQTQFDLWDDELHQISPMAHKSVVLSAEDLKKQRELIKKRDTLVRMLKDVYGDKNIKKDIRERIGTLLKEVETTPDDYLTDTNLSDWESEFKTIYADARTIEEQQQRDVEHDKMVREKTSLGNALRSRARKLGYSKKPEDKEKFNTVAAASKAFDAIADSVVTKGDIESAKAVIRYADGGVTKDQLVTELNNMKNAAKSTTEKIASTTNQAQAGATTTETAKTSSTAGTLGQTTSPTNASTTSVVTGSSTSTAQKITASAQTPSQKSPTAGPVSSGSANLDQGLYQEKQSLTGFKTVVTLPATIGNDLFNVKGLGTLVNMVLSNSVPGINLVNYDRTGGEIDFAQDIQNTPEFKKVYNNANGNSKYSLRWMLMAALEERVKQMIPSGHKYSNIHWWIQFVESFIDGDGYVLREDEKLLKYGTQLAAMPVTSGDATNVVSGTKSSVASSAALTGTGRSVFPASTMVGSAFTSVTPRTEFSKPAESTAAKIQTTQPTSTPAENNQPKDKAQYAEVAKMIYVPGAKVRGQELPTDGSASIDRMLMHIRGLIWSQKINLERKYGKSSKEAQRAVALMAELDKCGKSGKATLDDVKLFHQKYRELHELWLTGNTAKLSSGASEQAVSLDKNGNVVDMQKGSATSVSLRTSPGGQIIHTHPDGSPTSATDVASAIQNKQTAVTTLRNNIIGYSGQNTQSVLRETVNVAGQQAQQNTAELHSALSDMAKGIKDGFGSIGDNRDVLVGIYERLGDVIDAVSEHNGKVNDRIDMSTLQSYDLARRFTLKMTRKAKEVTSAFRRPVINISK